MEKHVNIIASLWIISGAVGLIFASIVFGVLFGVSFIPGIGVEEPIILRIVSVGFGLFLGILALPQVIGGIGLLRKQEWARILVLLVSFFSLLNFPWGTALGIYSIVILVKEETIKLFKASH